MELSTCNVFLVLKEDMRDLILMLGIRPVNLFQKCVYIELYLFCVVVMEMVLRVTKKANLRPGTNVVVGRLRNWLLFVVIRVNWHDMSQV